jgi:hypothetical protein
MGKHSTMNIPNRVRKATATETIVRRHPVPIRGDMSVKSAIAAPTISNGIVNWIKNTVVSLRD